MSQQPNASSRIQRITRRQVYSRAALLGLVGWSLYTHQRRLGLLALLALVLDAKHVLLPFLGSSAVPWALFTTSKTVRDADLTLRVRTEASAVVYWAAEPGSHASPQEAYAENAGVALTQGGYVALAVRNPGLYPYARNKRHVHYREIYFGTDLMGPVKTVYV